MAQKAGSLDILARTTLLTHTLTHTGKGAGGINGHDSAAYHCLMEQIGPEKTKKQTMNGSQSVGKDEVGSSNLPSSSNIKHSNLTVWVLFFLRFPNFLGQFVFAFMTSYSIFGVFCKRICKFPALLCT